MIFCLADPSHPDQMAGMALIFLWNRAETQDHCQNTPDHMDEYMHDHKHIPETDKRFSVYRDAGTVTAAEQSQQNAYHHYNIKFFSADSFF